jgi:hypothetical protein
VNGWDYEKSVKDRAMIFAQGQSPYYNMAPLMELLKEADRLGFYLVAKTPVQQQAEAFASTSGGET